MSEWVCYVRDRDLWPDDRVRQFVFDEHPTAKVGDSIETRVSRWLPDDALYIFNPDVLKPRFIPWTPMT